MASLPMTPARLANLDMVEFAANGTVYSTSSGIPGPSLAEATRRWKDHLSVSGYSLVFLGQGPGLHWGAIWDGAAHTSAKMLL